MPETPTDPAPVAVFDLDAASVDAGGHDEFVIRRGKIFAAGDYPDKDFSLSEAELAAAVAGFAPVPVDLEHTPTILSGRLGEVRSVEKSPDGKTMLGEVAIPRWLDRLMADGDRKVSATWDRARKRLVGLAIVRTPRLADAALFAAFSEAHPDDPEVAAFTPRKMTAEATRHMQGIHDHVAALSPGLCAAAFGDLTQQQKSYAKIHSLAVENGASCPGGTAAMSATPTPTPAPERKPMGFLDHMNRTYFGGKAKNVPALSPEVDAELTAAFADLEPAPKVVEAAVLAPAVAVAFSDTPEGKAMQAKLDRQAADLARLTAEADANRRAATERDAAAFAASLVQDRRIPAAFAKDVAALYARLADDDRSASAVVAFSGKDGATAEGGRVDALVAAFSRIPTPAEQYAAAVGGKAVFGVESVARGGESETPDPANVARLMALAGLPG